MLTIMQCGKCKYEVEWVIPDDIDDVYYMCPQYPKGIPAFVEEATEDCPRFEER
jgi:hypothetical protein